MHGKKMDNYSEYPIHYRSDGIPTRDSFIGPRPPLATYYSSGTYGLLNPKETRQSYKRRLEEVFICRAIYVVSILTLALGLKYGG